MTVRVSQVVTFAAEPFRGNPAYVVRLARDAPPALLGSLAGQFGQDVVAFLGPQDGDAVRLRFATAAGPHPGAGHAATAAAAVLLEDLTSIEVAFEDGTRRRFSREGDRIVVPWPAMAYVACELRQELGAALGQVPEQCLVAPFGYVAIYTDEAALRRMAPDMAALARLDRNAVIVTAPGIESDVAVRVFAPKVGLPEDPVCGTAHRIIVPYWSERLSRKQLHSRHLSPRGGDLWCEVDGATVAIAGQTYRFLDGELSLPD
ncbi:MAG: PhzF family phenazine biosynthesis protein [Geminicoccaceae bacterium]